MSRGVRLGVISEALAAGLFNYLGFVISGGSIIIESDVTSEELRMDRLRAMVIQEVLKEADIQERR